MFERFTDDAREVVKAAKRHAEDSGAEEVRPEHLLSALLDASGSLAVSVLEGLGAPAPDVRAELARRRAPFGEGLGAEDAEALEAIGIDLQAVLDRIESHLGGIRHGPGRIGFSRGTRKALELALREAIALKHRHIGTEHLLLGLGRADDRLVSDVLAHWSLRQADVRAAVAESVRRAG